MDNLIFTTLNLPFHLLSQVQKYVVLNACPIIRKFLSDDILLSNEDADKH